MCDSANDNSSICSFQKFKNYEWDPEEGNSSPSVLEDGDIPHFSVIHSNEPSPNLELLYV
jgi:hypothetical protein